MPERMRLFVPAYAATRSIAEVLVEAFPQFVVQAIIFVMVSEHVREGIASPVDTALFNAKDGAFVHLMPKSILLSSLTMLKIWYELVQEVSTLEQTSVGTIYSFALIAETASARLFAS